MELAQSPAGKPLGPVTPGERWGSRVIPNKITGQVAGGSGEPKGG